MSAWTAAGVAIAALGCRARAPTPAPPDETGALCADVGTLRACWGQAAADVRIGGRRLPAGGAASPMGWRCAGQGAGLRWVDRRAGAPPFVCDGPRCVQRHPRRPDDGEWSCADSAGSTICVGGERAAGVAPAPPDTAWLCGARPARGDDLGARVCVDLSPDFPDGDMAGWRCTSIDGPPGQRVCTREPSPAVLTAACTASHPCIDGSLCIGGRCVPPRPAPACWLDADCPSRRCRFGTCAEAGG